MNFTYKAVQQGFTLIELVVVIVILGILSATALPKFIDLTDDAELAVFEASVGAIISAANMAHVKQIAGRIKPNKPIVISGVSIAMTNGYPRDNSIGLLVDLSGFTYIAKYGVFAWDASDTTSCNLDYNYAGFKGNPTTDIPHVKVNRAKC